MPKKNTRNTRGRIIEAAWRLFYEQGYEETTVDDIIEASGTSRGSFYHYFEGKDTLLSTLSYLFDEKYQQLEPLLPADQDSFESLLFLNRKLFEYIENDISLDLLARLLSSQLITRGEKHLLDRSRVYYKLLRRLFAKGQKEGTLRADITANDFVKAYALAERALMYDWCLCSGEYSLADYGSATMARFMASYRA